MASYDFVSGLLKLLSQYLMPIGSAMFSTTFNLVTCVGLTYVLEH